MPSPDPDTRRQRFCLSASRTSASTSSISFGTPGVRISGPFSVMSTVSSIRTWSCFARLDDRLDRDDHARLEGQAAVADIVHAHAHVVAGAGRRPEAVLLVDGLADRTRFGAGGAHRHRRNDGLLRLEGARVGLQLAGVNWPETGHVRVMSTPR